MKDLAPNIDFGDSSFRYCEVNDRNLIVYIDSWQNNTIKIIFSNALKFIYRSASFIVGVFEKTDQDSFSLEILPLGDIKIVGDRPLKAFVIMDIEDHFSFEVVAEEVTIVKE